MKANLSGISYSAYAAWGLLVLRLAFATQLIWGTYDNVLSWERMLEFREFLEIRGVPYPLLAAQVSVWAQFICGMLWIIGWQTRLAASIMIFNFIAALLIAHVGLPYEQNFPAINLLAVSICLLFTGPGDISLAYLLAKKSNKDLSASSQ